MSCLWGGVVADTALAVGSDDNSNKEKSEPRKERRHKAPKSGTVDSVDVETEQIEEPQEEEPTFSNDGDDEGTASEGQDPVFYNGGE